MTGGAFVTGGSGFVGGAVIRHLVAAGRDVAALARSDAAASLVAARGARPVRGDLFDADALAGGMRGCDTAFHVAGSNVLCPADPSAVMRVNVAGTRAVVMSAVAAGVPRVVHTSSAAAIGERAGTVGRESSPHRGTFLSVYERSKFEGERAAFALGRERDVDVVAVNPASVQGPGRGGGTARLLVAYLNGRLPATVDVIMTIVDVDDCAAGHLLAERSGRPGERYLLAGPTLSVGDALRVLAEVCPAPPRRVPVAPAWTLGPAGWVAEAVWRLRGRRGPACREVAATLAHGRAYDGSRASRDLDLDYTPLAATLRRTVAWLAAGGLVSSAAETDGPRA